MKPAVRATAWAWLILACAGMNAVHGQDEHGAIVAWGDKGMGQCDVPSPNTGFVAVAAGFHHSLGLRADGSILAWGGNTDVFGYYAGQCDVPLPNTDFVGIAAGWFHTLGLKTDGSIEAWGWNDDYGQCNVPSPNTSFVAVAGGYTHSLGLKAHHGDLNCDGEVNGGDIAAFVSALLDPASYASQYRTCHMMNGDLNGDGAVNDQDIDEYVVLLIGD